MSKYSYDSSHADVSGYDQEVRKLHPVCLDILHRRGYQDNDAIRALLFPKLKEAVTPFHAKDAEYVIQALAQAVQKKMPIVVYRDYDVDGICAGAIATHSLRLLGATVHHYANDREQDGYGICKNGIDTILKQWPDTKIILTVDNGISAIDAVSYAYQKGLIVLITDHHLPGEHMPDAAVAIVDPKRRDEIYPFQDLCGTAVIFRIMLDLFRLLGWNPQAILRQVDLVALATVADVMPLLGENRAYVKSGLKLIRAGERPFFKVLNRLTETKEFSAHGTLGFQYAPLLNSLSRMGEDTDIAVEALISSDETWIETQVLHMINVNQARKEETKKEWELVDAIASTMEQEPVLVVYEEQLREGIVGILAGKLKEKYEKPAFVFAPAADGIWKGSGRSFDYFPLKEQLDQIPSLLCGYGGHTKAAGLSVTKENMPRFIKEIRKLASSVSHQEEPPTPLAAVLDESSITEELILSIKAMEPFGEAFPEPILGVKTNTDRIEYFGKERQHVRHLSPTSNLVVIEWNKAEKVRNLGRIRQKFIGKPMIHEWNGKKTLQFVCQD